jgi:hypothetical protein
MGRDESVEAGHLRELQPPQRPGKIQSKATVMVT